MGVEPLSGWVLDVIMLYLQLTREFGDGAYSRLLQCDLGTDSEVTFVSRVSWSRHVEGLSKLCLLIYGLAKHQQKA